MKVYAHDDPEVPGFAWHSSTFKNDERCEAVWVVIGDDEDEVWSEVVDTFDKKPNNYVDYDVNYSTEGDTYVGIIVRDK